MLSHYSRGPRARWEILDAWAQFRKSSSVNDSTCIRIYTMLVFTVTFEKGCNMLQRQIDCFQVQCLPLQQIIISPSFLGSLPFDILELCQCYPLRWSCTSYLNFCSSWYKNCLSWQRGRTALSDYPCSNLSMLVGWILTKKNVCFQVCAAMKLF